MPIDRDSLPRLPNNRKRMKFFYLNGHLHRILKRNRAADLVQCIDYIDEKVKTYVYSEVLKRGRRAYTIREVCDLVGLHRDSLTKYMRDGSITKPQREKVIDKYSHALGREGRYFFSEEQVIEIHLFFATRPQGRPSKNGFKENNVRMPLDQFIQKLHTGRTLYIRNDDGQFIPIWQDDTI
jgi:hypothetical protein